MDNIRLIESVSEETTINAPYVFALKTDTYVPSTTAVTSATISVDEKVTENKTATLRWMKHVVDEQTLEEYNANNVVFDLRKFSTFKVDGVEQVPQTQDQTKSITYVRQELSLTYDEDNYIHKVNNAFDEDLLFNDGDGSQFSFEDLTMAKGIYGAEQESYTASYAVIFKIEDENNVWGMPIGLYVMPTKIEDLEDFGLWLSMLKPSKYTVVKIKETEVDQNNPQALTSITILPQKVSATNLITYSFPSAKEYYIEFDYKQGVTEVTKGMFQPIELDIIKTQSTLPYTSLVELSDNVLDGITSIDDSAFYACSGLTSIEILSSVTSIGEWAFADCRGLAKITIPSSVTSIGEAAFNNCHDLTSITIPSSVTSIGNRAFEYCIYEA